MFRLPALLLYGVRHLVVVVAILATLSTALGVHLHVESGHGIDVVTKFDMGDQSSFCLGHEGHDHPPLSPDADPDGCGDCHCATPTGDVASAATPIVTAASIGLVDYPEVCQTHDGMTYQPDPPPVLG